MTAVERILGALVRAAALVGVLSIVALMGLTVVTVTFRFLGIAFPGTYVLAELLIIPAVSLSLAYAAWEGAHTRVELLTQTLRARTQGWLQAAMLVLGSVGLLSPGVAARRGSGRRSSTFRWRRSGG